MTNLYTNRAMCRFNLGNHDGVVADCNACIAANPLSVKAHYFLSKSLSALGDHETASSEASEAYAVCRSTGDDKSLTMTHDWLLQCRTERWRSAERARVREYKDLEAEVLALLARDRDETVAGAGAGDVDKAVVWEESEKKMAQIRNVFEKARSDEDKARDVPQWLMDDITFDVMTDPVIVRPPTIFHHAYSSRLTISSQTQSGRSYQRSSIISAINSKAIDPVTREPLKKDELRPNLALRQACEWYLNDNGWAYDW